MPSFTQEEKEEETESVEWKKGEGVLTTWNAEAASLSPACRRSNGLNASAM